MVIVRIMPVAFGMKVVNVWADR